MQLLLALCIIGMFGNCEAIPLTYNCRYGLRKSARLLCTIQVTLLLYAW